MCFSCVSPMLTKRANCSAMRKSYTKTKGAKCAFSFLHFKSRTIIGVDFDIIIREIARPNGIIRLTTS